MARARNPNPTAYCLTIGGRGPNRLPSQGPGMSYHHLIPFEALHTFWNTAIACDPEPLRETLIPALIRAMPAYPLDPENPPRAKRLIESAGRLLHMLWAGHYVHSPTVRGPDGIDDFNAAYTWMPGNLFGGPGNRVDDPGDRFDNFASRVVESDRYLKALRAYRAIQVYLDQGPGRDHAQDAEGARARARVGQLAHTAGLALARVAAYTDPTAYDPARW